RHEFTNQPELDAVLADLLPEGSSTVDHNQVIASLVKILEPPSGARRVTRRIHPDWMILFVCAVGLVIAYQSATNDPGDVPIIVSLLSACLLVYLLVRRPVMLRYESQTRQEQEEKNRIEQAVAHWMRLYFCSRDQIVFDPD